MNDFVGIPTSFTIALEDVMGSMHFNIAQISSFLRAFVSYYMKQKMFGSHNC